MKTIKVAFTPDAQAQEITISRFEELFGITYFPHLVFANWEVEDWIRRKCARAFKKGRIKKLALWLGKLHGSQIDAAEIPDLTIRWVSNEIGYGLFTNRPLKQWEFIGEYTGTLRKRNLFFPNINDYCFMYPRAWVSIKALTIDSKTEGCYTRFINHSDYPNCESVAIFHGDIFHIIFRTIQEIPANTQLTYDYGSIYWNRRKKIVEEPIESLIAPEDLKKLQNDLSKN
jgi:uncharacterized protein